MSALTTAFSWAWKSIDAFRDSCCCLNLPDMKSTIEDADIKELKSFARRSSRGQQSEIDKMKLIFEQTKLRALEAPSLIMGTATVTFALNTWVRGVLKPILLLLAIAIIAVLGGLASG